VPTELFLTVLFVHFLDAIHWKSVPELWTTPNGIKEKLSVKNKLQGHPTIVFCRMLKFDTVLAYPENSSPFPENLIAFPKMIADLLSLPKTTF